MKITKLFLHDRTALAGFVEGQLMDLSPDWPLIITITLEKSGGFCVHTVTDALSADIEYLTSLERLQNTSPATTRAGMYQDGEDGDNDY